LGYQIIKFTRVLIGVHTRQGAQRTELILWAKRPAQQAETQQLLQPLTIQDIRRIFPPSISPNPLIIYELMPKST
jgi:hypothetical protein